MDDSESVFLFISPQVLAKEIIVILAMDDKDAFVGLPARIQQKSLRGFPGSPVERVIVLLLRQRVQHSSLPRCALGLHQQGPVRLLLVPEQAVHKSPFSLALG